jgi:hypothetical protein
VRNEGKKGERNEGKKKRAYGTPDSHVVPHRSTDRACSGLTAQFGRDTVLFTEYGRRRVQKEITRIIYYTCSIAYHCASRNPPGAALGRLVGEVRGSSSSASVPIADRTRETTAAAPLLVA